MQKPILLISLLFLFLITAVILFLFPEYHNFRDLRISLAKAQKDLDSKNDYFNNIRNTSAKFSNYKEQIEKIDLMLPEDPGIPDFFNFIITKALKNGLVVNTIRDSSIFTSSENKIKRIILHISLSGAYDSFKNFLKELQSNVRLIEIDGISFSSSKGSKEKENENEVFNFNLKARIHSY